MKKNTILRNCIRISRTEQQQITGGIIAPISYTYLCSTTFECAGRTLSICLANCPGGTCTRVNSRVC